jgi:hypothetical protein
MGNVKHWSTGALGNTYGVDPGYTNTKGLDTNNLPGVEGYIPEDEVDANADNRPLKNLTDNDIILETDASDVASVVDHGVFKGRYNEFALQVQVSGTYSNPENPNSTINITPLRIESGSAIINGQITRIGNQQIVYFLRSDGSQLFPDYSQMTLTSPNLTIVDPDFWGSYSPVFDSVAEGLPTNYAIYNVTIRNIDTHGGGHTDVYSGPYTVYRDWEDIIPLAPETSIISTSNPEVVSFVNDFNYGQFSDGYWLKSPYVDSSNNTTYIQGTSVDSVVLQKNILVTDDVIQVSSSSGFALNNATNSYEYTVNTDGIFFDNVNWTNATLDADIQDLYIDTTNTNNMYFITRSTDVQNIWFRSGAAGFSNTIELQPKSLQMTNQLPLGLVMVNGYIVIYGTQGYLAVMQAATANLDFTSSNLTLIPNTPLTTQTIRSVYVWDNKVWVAGDTSLWYSDLAAWNSPTTLTTASFTLVDLTQTVKDSIGNQVISRINVLERVRGNSYIDSALQNSIDNVLLNPSYESGGVGLVPQFWSVGDNAASTSTLKIVSRSTPDSNFSQGANSYASLLVTSPATSAWAQPQTPYTPPTIAVGNSYTFSVYLQSPSAITAAPVIQIQELDANGTAVANAVSSTTCMPSAGLGQPIPTWTRFSVTRTITSANTVSILPKVVSNQNTALLIDCSQLESGTATSQYVENFEYLLIGFTKVPSNTTDAPFALIDISDKYNVKYDNGKYGSIASMNDVISTGHNEVHFVSDTQVHILTFLNNENQYDRYTITSAFDDDLTGRIAKFESIVQIGNRIFFSGTPANKVIRIITADSSAHTIEIKDVVGYESLLSLLGGTTFVPFSIGYAPSIEFNRTTSSYEGASTSLGVYVPYVVGGLIVKYAAQIYVDGVADALITITPPSPNQDPWTIDQIYSAFQTAFNTWVLANPNQTKISLPVDLDSSPTPLHQSLLKDSNNVPQWPNPISSSSIIDGIYSIGKSNLSRYIKGNIHKILALPGISSYFFVVQGTQILMSKYDPNILKRAGANGSYPNPGDPDYITYWNLLNTDYNLTHFRNKINNEVSIADAPYDRSWFSFPAIDSGYSVLEGSIRVKTNQTTEVGFAEGIDYVVDYANNRIIRYDGTNYLQNPSGDFSTSVESTLLSRGGSNYTSPSRAYNQLPSSANDNDFYYVADTNNPQYNGYYFWNGTGWTKFYNDNIPDNWTFYLETQDDPIESRIMSLVLTEDNFTTNGIQTWVEQATGQSTSPQAIIYQVFDLPFTPTINDTTMTFSVYLKSYVGCTGMIRLIECDNSNATLSGSINNGYAVDQTIYTIDPSSINTWTRWSVSHTFQNTNSNRVRVEIQINTSSQLIITKTQLERGTLATPFMDGTMSSKMSPDMNVFIDYTEYRNLVSGTDYTFNAIDSGTAPNRKIRLNQTIFPSLTSADEFTFQYKYQKIFNPYDFGNNLPTTQKAYNFNDDYFLYTVNGRIWAINQMLAMLSLDTIDPLTISYNYHFPRIDQLKVRNVPDQYGNYLYIVKGISDPTNPYKPNDAGPGTTYGIANEIVPGNSRYYNSVDVTIMTANQNILANVDNTDNDILYEVNVVYSDYDYNNVFDRRSYIDSGSKGSFNISLLPETIAYFPFVKDFNATNGIGPINFIQMSKIVPIIKNYLVVENNEVGAWHDGYQLNLRTTYPGNAWYVDPINGLDTNAGTSSTNAFKTVAAAVAALTTTTPNIVITQPTVLNEDIQINPPAAFTVGIYASSYCYWRGGLQNIGPLIVQGIYFQNTNIYPLNQLTFQWCTIEDSSINCAYPQNVSWSNTEFKNCHTDVLRVNNSLFPSPFIFPYEALEDLSGGSSTKAVATSDSDSVYPGFFYANTILTSSSFTFTNCLAYNIEADFVRFDPDLPWTGSFTFEACTIAYNTSLFNTNKTDLAINYIDSIIYKNRTSSTDLRAFTCNSIITLSNCYTDFNFGDVNFLASEINYGTGTFNTLSCSGNATTANPDFVGIGQVTTDFYLQSVARGSVVDSPCLSDTQDLGCFLETRGSTNTDVPKKLRSYVAYIDEPLYYPITLNSEKITITLQFKPIGGVNSPGVIFDTRAAPDDVDYIILAYNNNDPTSFNPYPDQGALISSNPYRFRVLVGNAVHQYVIVSPILIQTDEDFQQWHTLSFTVNFELGILPKTGFATQDKVQNVITLYHNKATEIESFIKYNLNRENDGTLVPGRGTAPDNDWDYNNICQFITLGSSYVQNVTNPDVSNATLSMVMKGYYAEFRIDNRYIDRKQFELWNSKQVPFNDPLSYVNQNPLARTFENRTLSEYWALDNLYSRGAKGNYFVSSNQRYMYDSSRFTWFLGRPVTNLINNPNFLGMNTAQVVGSTAITYAAGMTFSQDWRVYVVDSGSGITASRHAADNDRSGAGGIILHMHTGNYTINSQIDFSNALTAEFANWTDHSTMLAYRFTPDGRLIFYTKDMAVTQVAVSFGSSGTDYTEVGYTALTTVGTTTAKNLSTWSIPNDLPTISPAEQDTLYFNYNPEYLKNSSNSLVLTKATVSSDISVYQTVSVSTLANYTVSFYFYYDQSNLNNPGNTVVSFYYDSGIIPFDSIERLDGNWWLAIKNILNMSGQHSIGITLGNSIGTIYLDSCQLEIGDYATPYTTYPIATHGGLVINNDLLNKQKGTIFFKFRPKFDFNEPRADGIDQNHPPRILFEMLGIVPDATTQIPTLQNNLGFKVIYYFDVLKNRGIIEFSINNDSSTMWDLELANQFWDQWHSVGIVYDFDTNRFVYWFDYFNNSIDQVFTNNYTYNNLYIAQASLGTGKTYAGWSSDLEIRDIIIASYPTSDIEIQTWVKTYEFFSSSQISSTLIDFETNVQNLITQVSGYAGLTSDVEGQLSSLSGEMAIINGIVSSQGNTLTSLGLTVGTLQSNVNGLVTSYNSINSSITNLNNDISSIIGPTVTSGSPVPIEKTLTALYDSIGSLRQQESSDVATLGSLINTKISNLASNSTALGASLIGVAPAFNTASGLTGTTVETALEQMGAEMLSISSALSGSGNITSTLNQIKDGNTGSTWTNPSTQNLVSLANGVVANATAISTEATNRANADTTNINNLASTTSGLGASLVGVASTFVNINPLNYAGITTVEGALEAIASTISTLQSNSAASVIGFNPILGNVQFSPSSNNIQAAIDELAGNGRQSSMTVAANYTAISNNTTNIAANAAAINQMKDGSTGLTWSSSQNLVNLVNSIAPIALMQDGIDGNTWNSNFGYLSTSPYTVNGSEKRANLWDHESRLHVLELTSSSAALGQTYLQLNPSVPQQYLQGTLLPNDNTINLGASGIHSFGNLYVITANVSGNMTISGNLIVNGNTTTISSTNVTVADVEMILNYTTPGINPIGETGIRIRRAKGTAEGDQDSKILWNESSGRWQTVYGSNGSSISNIATFDDLTWDNIINKPLTTPSSVVIYDPTASPYTAQNPSGLRSTNLQDTINELWSYIQSLQGQITSLQTMLASESVYPIDGGSANAVFNEPEIIGGTASTTFDEEAIDGGSATGYGS